MLPGFGLREEGRLSVPADGFPENEAPGQILTYARNIHTLEELDRNGFAIISSEDILSSKRQINGLCAVTIAGSELPRGGGGARCMTMPLARAKVDM